MRQIKLITNSLIKEKEKYLYELSKLNTTITNKISTIDKMKSYQNDYLNSYNLNLSKSIPGLNMNINLFVKKIDMVIDQAKFEVNTLQQIRESLLVTIDNINKKIDMMSIFESKQQVEMRVKEEKQEQIMLDDMSMTMDIRREDE